MRKIYISTDGQYQCFVQDGENRKAVMTDKFDGKCGSYIERYRYIPEGEIWIRADGALFEGETLCPITDYRELDAAQRQNECAALKYVGIIDANAPMEQAATMRAAIDVVIADMDDTAAINIPVLFPNWSDSSTSYKTGDRVKLHNKLYKCLQNHVSQPDWAPGLASSLWGAINDPAIEWPEWVQPTGAHDAYKTGTKVTHNGVRYISIIDANITEPGTDERWWQEQV